MTDTILLFDLVQAFEILPLLACNFNPRFAEVNGSLER
jgi:hypothetical protein